MKFTAPKCAFVTAPLFALALSILPQTAFGQQITYYDFDTPQANPNQVSYQCSSGSTTNPLFCFNDGTGQASSPSFLSDTYPSKIDPNQTDNPPVQSTHTAIQQTFPLPNQSSSMWFSVPQKISSGFTSYFAFKMTPDTLDSYATADGIAFVIQNSAGGGAVQDCTSSGAGPSIVGGRGGCMGYGGIDNSLAIELDTYRNEWDPVDNSTPFNDNHIAIQNCGPGLPNNPRHTTSCQVNFNGNIAAINSQLGVTLADGNVHEVVVVYSGPNEAVPNLLQIYIDPPFVPETHTPTAAAVPVLSGIYNIAANLNLRNSGSANDSAFVGFTSATGSAFEQHELMAWTFTPHTPVTQEQPLSPPGQPTVFPFGSHVYAVTYPVDGPPTAGIDMIVTATTISPLLFSQLVSGGPFAGSQCQVYDDTGGNCVVYSASCVNSATNLPVQCPVTDPSADTILVKSAYNNSIPPVTPGYLQGDPFFSQVTSIVGNGQTATVTCAGECSVTTGQTVTIAGAQPGQFNGTVTVLAADPSVPNAFTFASTATGTTTTGGFLTSNNLQNIFFSFSPQRIDATTTGKTHNFSDFIVTSVTTAPTTLTISAPTATYGTTAPVTVTATSANGTPTGNMLLSVDNGAPLTQPLSAGSATFNLTGLTAGPHQLTATYPTTGVFLGNTGTGSITISMATPTVTFTGAPASAAYGSSFMVTATSNASTVPLITASGACKILANTVTMTSGTGLCNLQASWAADNNYTAATATQSVGAVKAASSTMVLTDTPNPSMTQSPVMLTFKVSGSSVPTGPYSVSSNVAGDPSCSGVLIAGAGSCSLTFQTAGARTLTISYVGDTNFIGSSAMVQQSVNGGPVATLSTNSLNFGTLYLGDIKLQSVTLTNTGSAAMTISGPFIFDVGNGDSKEFIAVNLCPRSLPAGKSCNFTVAFIAGPSYNPQTAILKIMDNAPGAPQTVNLLANVINPQASFKPGSVNFGTQRVGSSVSSTISLTNSGATALAISNKNVIGVNASDFSQTNNCPASLTAGASCMFSVTFTPTKTGTRTAYLNVVDNTRSGSQQVPLSGTGK